MHAVVTTWESESYVATTEFYSMGSLLVFCIGSDDRGVVDRLSYRILQYAALLSHLIGAGKYRYVVEQYCIVTHIGKYQ